MPYVFLAMPGAKHSLPEQRRLLIAGDPGDRQIGRPKGVTPSPYTSLEGRTSGSTRAARRRSPAARRPTRRVWMLKSIVREALYVGHVDRAAGQVPDEPGVDRSRTRGRPARRAARAPGTLSRIQCDLLPEKYGSTTSPVFAGDRAVLAVALSVDRRTSAVRRSCQTIALCTRLARSRGPRRRSSRAGW